MRSSHAQQIAADMAWLAAREANPPKVREPDACDGCKYFERDRINPPAGMGICQHAKHHGYFYPRQPHYCADRTTTKEI